jgi:hypothetical protein
VGARGGPLHPGAGLPATRARMAAPPRGHLRPGGARPGTWLSPAEMALPNHPDVAMRSSRPWWTAATSGCWSRSTPWSALRPRVRGAPGVVGLDRAAGRKPGPSADSQPGNCGREHRRRPPTEASRIPRSGCLETSNATSEASSPAPPGSQSGPGCSGSAGLRGRWAVPGRTVGRTHRRPTRSGNNAVGVTNIEPGHNPESASPRPRGHGRDRTGGGASSLPGPVASPGGWTVSPKHHRRPEARQLPPRRCLQQATAPGRGSDRGRSRP